MTEQPTVLGIKPDFYNSLKKLDTILNFLKVCLLYPKKDLTTSALKLISKDIKKSTKLNDFLKLFLF